MAKAIDVANSFIARAARDGKKLTHLQVMKLSYIAHGVTLAKLDRPLVEVEHAQAWEFGPVFPSIYREFKIFGRKPIDKASRAGKKLTNKSELEIVDEVWKTYGQLSGSQLSAITHRENSPWHEVSRAFGGQIPAGIPIPDHRIKQHYKELLKIA